MLTIARRTMIAVLAGTLVMWGSAAAAALVSRDLRAPGDALLTLDTATGLSWLDVTATQGLSWNAVTAGLSAGGLFAGFRRATEADIATFWADAGIPDVAVAGGTATAANFQPIRSLQQLWGDTGALPSIPGATATLVTNAQSFDPVDNTVEGTPLLLLFESQGTGRAVLRTLLGVPPGQSVPFVAHALVQVVPEPSTVLLFIAGIVSGGLVRAHRRR